MSRLSSGLTLSAAAGAALYVVFAAFSGFREVSARLSAFDWAAAAGALALASANYGIRFGRWELYLGRLGLRVPRARSLGIFLAGFALTVTPGKIGEVLKSYLLRESDGVPMARSAPIVFAERVTDLVGCLLLMLLGIGSATPSKNVLAAAGVGAAMVVGLVAVVASPRLGELVIGLLGRLPVVGKMAPKLREAHAATRELLAPGPLLFGTLLAVLAWFCECAAFWLVIRGFGATASLPLSTFIYAATTVAGAVSFLPGGLGVQEGGMIGLLVAAGGGIDEPSAFAATFVTRVCTLWYAVLVGVVALLLFRRTARVAVDLGEVAALRKAEGGGEAQN